MMLCEPWYCPELIEQRRDSKRLSFWSAAASSGQEAYSLAMMLLEMGLGDWNIQILATDLSTQVLERARTGKFLQIEVNRGLPVSYLVKYFTRAGLDWQLKDAGAEHGAVRAAGSAAKHADARPIRRRLLP